MSAVLERSLAVLDADIAALDGWPALDPLPEADTSEADPFPFASMGDELGDAAKAIAEGVQAPDALTAGSVLASVALGAQPLINIIAPHGQRITPVCLS